MTTMNSGEDMKSLDFSCTVERMENDLATQRGDSRASGAFTQGKVHLCSHKALRIRTVYRSCFCNSPRLKMTPSTFKSE
jgi:hypothetical protein